MNQPIETIDSTRRLILKGAAMLALMGLAGIRFGLTSAFAATNDKYPEDAFKQKSDADAIKSAVALSAACDRPSRTFDAVRPAPDESRSEPD